MSQAPKQSSSPVANWSRKTAGGATFSLDDRTGHSTGIQRQSSHVDAQSGGLFGSSRNTLHNVSSGPTDGDGGATMLPIQRDSMATVTFRSAGGGGPPAFSTQSPMKRFVGPVPAQTAATETQRSASSGAAAAAAAGSLFGTPLDPPPPRQGIPASSASTGAAAARLLFPEPQPVPSSRSTTSGFTGETNRLPPAEGRVAAFSSAIGGLDEPLAAARTSSAPQPRPSSSSLGDGLGGAKAVQHPTSVGGGPPPSSVATQRAIPEAQFLSDILFLWLGVERTKYFRYHAGTSQYECVSPMEVAPRQRSAMQSLQECGLVAMEVEALLQRSSSEMSFLQQSLRAAVRSHMTQYHYLLSSLRERVESLTVADLVVAHKRALPRLNTLCMILTETTNAKGGELVSKMQALGHQGSQRLAALVQEVHLVTVTPLLQMSIEWILKGDVADPFEEFFIKVNPNIEITSDLFWSHRFSVEPLMLPTTVAPEVALDILKVGRNIVFITKCCRAKQWRMDPSIVLAAQTVTFATLARFVEQALTFTNASVMRLVHEKLKLREVLTIVQQFLLVGHGDFFEALLRKLDPMMTKPSTSIQASVVADHVQSVLLETATHQAKFLDTELLMQLEPELVKADKTSGWDGFSFSLSLASPLNNVYDAEGKRAYRRLFRFLFQVKRAEVALKQSWRQSVVLDRVMVRMKPDHPETSVWRKVAGDAHLLGQQLNHFVINLWSYLVAEVSSTAWERWRRAMAACRSFDEVREAHAVYLQQLLLLSLHHGDLREVRETAVTILGLARELCVVQAQLTNLLERGVGNIISISSEYQRIADSFEAQMTALLRQLEEQHMHYEFLNYLLLRLNFNQFYRDHAEATRTNTEF